MYEYAGPHINAYDVQHTIGISKSVLKCRAGEVKHLDNVVPWKFNG